ncbi:MAG: mechanosensitive ion channel, partial [Sphingomonadales bacterium]|nr:mechanosensitive ion channel [Sphingomonadales bacterium]
LFAARLIDVRLKKVDAITPSAQVLIIKVIKIVFVSVAFLIALNSTGIDLTALAVFGGALGVGLGFGLQKVVSNFISGVILLLDNSIKPGDVVQVQDTYGSVNALNARYTSIITRDGTEFLIPNEDMITKQVVNWSHSHTNVRRRIPVCVGYDSDVEKVMAVLVKAATDNNRVLSNPLPQARLMGFGDNGINLELRMWINDPQNGVRNVASEVLLEILNVFRAEGINLPYPQRVVHIKDGADKL